MGRWRGKETGGVRGRGKGGEMPMGPEGRQVSVRGPAVAKDGPGQQHCKTVTMKHSKSPVPSYSSL